LAKPSLYIKHLMIYVKVQACR